MATQIIMPKLGMAMKEGIVGKWLIEDGAAVELDEIIAVIVTKKITYELKAPAAGFLHHKARIKETKPVGATIGYILAHGEAVPDMEGGALPPFEMVVSRTGEPAKAGIDLGQKPNGDEQPAAVRVQSGGFVVATPAARRKAREAGVELTAISGSGPGGRVTEDDVRAYLDLRAKVLITSAARKLAQEHGLDITNLEGSGPGGRITEADVQRLIATPPVVAAPPVPPQPGQAPAAGRRVPLQGLRQMIAENMVNSLQTMAQVTVTTEVDVTELVALHERLKQDFEVTYTDLIVKATTIALKKHPRLNATLVGDEIQLLDELNIGVGVALEEGLIVPVIHNAGCLSLQQIGAIVRDLAAKARSHSLDLDEVTGGTFTITNLGVYGIDAFTPVINPPEAAILGVGRIVEKLVIYRGDAARRSMLVLSLTFDHRLVDGAPAAAFLQTLADVLSHPYYLGA